MDTLDNPPLMKQLDAGGMLACLHDFPALVEQAWRLALDFDLPRDYAAVDKVVILGMGGSAIGGDLASDLVSPQIRLPIITHRDYHLPAFADDRTLVIASSYSGTTEETLSAFRQALETGAKKLVITTGGELKTLAEQHHLPVFAFTYRAQPRAALPFSLMPVLGCLQKLGFIRDISTDVAGTVKTLQDLSARLDETVPPADNPAKRLAQALYGHLPVIYGSGITTAVARRWKGQLNENGKAWAFHEVFPELNHNAVVGYQFPTTLADKIKVIMLRSSRLSPRIRRRYEVTGQLLGRAGVDYYLVDGEGESDLSQLLSLVLYGDWVSFYLAMLYDIDPSPVESIAYLKSELARG